MHISYAPLNEVSATHVSTDQAAYYLMRRPNTLRIWAMGQKVAPITPIRINRRLAWPTSKLRELCGVSA